MRRSRGRKPTCHFDCSGVATERRNLGLAKDEISPLRSKGRSAVKRTRTHLSFRLQWRSHGTEKSRAHDRARSLRFGRDDGVRRSRGRARRSRGRKPTCHFDCSGVATERRNLGLAKERDLSASVEMTECGQEDGVGSRGHTPRHFDCSHRR